MGRHHLAWLILCVSTSAGWFLLAGSVLPIWPVDYIDVYPTDASMYGTVWRLFPDIPQQARADYFWGMWTTYWFGYVVRVVFFLAVGAAVGRAVYRRTCPAQSRPRPPHA